MLNLNDGQCGLCAHFGEDHPDEPKLVQIRTSKQADETYTEKCGHPKHEELDLVVTPISGCEGFTPAKPARPS
jgi:hypothetical protein